MTTTVEYPPLSPSSWQRTSPVTPSGAPGSSAPGPRWHQRLPGPTWARLGVAVTVTVVVLSTILALIIAFRAPTVSPVSPLPGGAVVAPAPTGGLLDLFGGGVGAGGRGGGFGGGRGR